MSLPPSVICVMLPSERLMDDITALGNRNNNIVTLMSASNPFKLETDNKKFFFDVVNKSALEVVPEYTKTDTGNNRIKNMASELE